MKRSIRTRYTLIIIAIMAGVIAAICLFNIKYLEDYYFSEKQTQIEEARELVYHYLDDGMPEDEEIDLRRLCSIANINVVIFQKYNAFALNVFSTSDGDAGMNNRLMNQLLGRISENKDDQIYESGNDFRTYKTLDKRTQSYQIDCIGSRTVNGNADQEYYFALTTSVQSIVESAVLTNRFLVIVGCGAILIGAVVVFFITGRMTRPITALTRQSQQMTQLNFTQRFQGHSGDEIQELGDNMNLLSEQLSKTIRELKDANHHLEEDIKEKERIDQLRRELLANISHELKTPLALIQGYAEGLSDGISEDPESRKEYCDIILDETGKMNRLVKQLLNLDEIESGTMKPEPEEFDLAEMLRGAVNAIGLEAKTKNVEIIQEMPEHLPVYTDEFMLEEVAQNYLSNALHYVKEGGIIRIRAGVHEQGRCWFSVYNTGDWIPEASLDEIWGKFYKVDKARTRAYGGSGIGLSIVKAIMENMGGSCGVANVEDGVEFVAEWKSTKA